MNKYSKMLVVHDLNVKNLGLTKRLLKLRLEDVTQFKILDEFFCILNYNDICLGLGELNV